MTLRRSIIISLILATSWAVSSAQIVSSDHKARNRELLRTSELVQLPTKRLATFDTDSARIALENSSAQLRAYAFAHTIETDINIIEEGYKTKNSDQDNVWRYRIRSTGAKSLGLYFGEFQLPEGAYLYIYSTLNPEECIGGFGAENNNDYNALPIQPIQSDDIVIEVTARQGSTPKLRLSEVYHGVRSIDGFKAGTPNMGDPKGLKCTPEVACFPEYNDISRSVVLILMGGDVLGTGTLINNTNEDGRPLILTASHVISFNFIRDNIEEQAKRAIYFFNYQTPMCDSSIQPQTQQSIAGSKLLGYHPTSDIGLLELNQTPPADYQVYYAGWNAQPNLNEAHFNIHHPIGYTKRVNLAMKPLTYVSYPADGYPFGTDMHFKLPYWDMGTTAGGSSGSPLFDPLHRAIGLLTGGDSYCDRQMSDYFASLEKLWAVGDPASKKIVEQLDPTGKGANRACAGYTNTGGANAIPQRITNMAIPAGVDNLVATLTQLNRDEVLGIGNGVAKIAESYRLVSGTKIYGAYIMLPTKEAHTEDLMLDVLGDSGKAPLYSTSIPLDELSSNNKTDRLQELYVTFEKPIDVNTDQLVFFSLDTDKIPRGLTIANQIQGDINRNSLWWYINHKWMPYSEATKGKSASLWIDPIVGHSNIKPINPPGLRIRLTPMGEDWILVTLGDTDPDSAKQIDIYTLQGQRLYAETRTGSHFKIPRSAVDGVGIVVIRIETEQWKDGIKAYFPPK